MIKHGQWAVTDMSLRNNQVRRPHVMSATYTCTASAFTASMAAVSYWSPSSGKRFIHISRHGIAAPSGMRVTGFNADPSTVTTSKAPEFPPRGFSICMMRGCAVCFSS
jgi:hypothetical protein